MLFADTKMQYAKMILYTLKRLIKKKLIRYIYFLDNNVAININFNKITSCKV